MRPSSLFTSMFCRFQVTRPSLSLFLLVLSACASTAGGGYTKRLTGQTVPTGPGHAGDRCTGPSSATLVIDRSSRRFTFAPADGALRLSGLVGANGTIQASTNTQPPGKTPYIVTLHGVLGKDSFNGTYETPLCLSAVALKTSDGLGIILAAPDNALGL
ncbi:putative secreted protein [Granulibacter bethesdensis]|uniref:Secreted protein n=1 Tax=Granulibacter bethesdensis TaxID=364410 RepID=A0AAC9P9N1_9PROT|nr:hypothetical protein [Granulibacter bethesdensis]APH55204.1 putative secreted protein [Granulibacter bethesdensis]APH62791.1 putative secreted protein [Granulibacter bethesdensis]